MKLYKTLPILAALVGAAGCHQEKGGPSNHLKTHSTSPPPNSVLHEELGIADSYKQLVDWNVGSRDHEQVPVEITRKGENFFPFFEVDPREEVPYFQVVYKTCLTVYGDVSNGKITCEYAPPDAVGVFKFTEVYKAGVTLQDITKALEDHGVEVLKTDERPGGVNYGPAVTLKVRTNWKILKPLIHLTSTFKY